MKLDPLVPQKDQTDAFSRNSDVHHMILKVNHLIFTTFTLCVKSALTSFAHSVKSILIFKIPIEKNL